MSVFPHRHAADRIALTIDALMRTSKSERFVLDHFTVETLDKMSYILLISRPDDPSEWIDKIKLALAMVKMKPAPKTPEGEAMSCLQLHLTERLYSLANSLCGHFGEITTATPNKLTHVTVDEFKRRHVSNVRCGFFEKEVKRMGKRIIPNSFDIAMKNARRLLDAGSVYEVRIPVPPEDRAAVEALAPELDTSVHAFGIDQGYRFVYMTTEESLNEDMEHYSANPKNLTVVMDKVTLRVVGEDPPKISAAETLCRAVDGYDVAIDVLWPRRTRAYACALVV